MSKLAVIVIGAPRSGTSAVSHLLSELGVYFGERDRFVDPASHGHNPIFFELESVNKLNTEVLAEFGHAYGEFDFFPRADELDGENYQPFVERAQHLVMHELGNHELIGLKDPRFVFTLPLWESALTGIGFVIRYVATDRGVADIVRSNRTVYQVSEAHQRRIALVSVGLAAARLVGKEHFVVNYDDLLESPAREAEELASWLGLDPRVSERAARVIRTELRHHHASGSDPLGGCRVSSLSARAEQYGAMRLSLEKYGILDLLDSLRERLRVSVSQAEEGGLVLEIKNAVAQLIGNMGSYFDGLTAIADAAQAQNVALERMASDRADVEGRLETSLRLRIEDLESRLLEGRRAAARSVSDLNVAHGEIYNRDVKIKQLMVELATGQQNLEQVGAELVAIQQKCQQARTALAVSRRRVESLSSEVKELLARNAALQPVRAKVRWYIRTYGRKALLKRLLFGRSALPRPQPEAPPHQRPGIEIATEPAPSAAQAEVSLPRTIMPASCVEPATPAHALVSRRFQAIQPLPVVASSGPEARVNLVTDSINTGSLFGGVGTAIIVSTLLAGKRGARLRVVTRTEQADAEGLAQVLACNGIKFDGDVEFEHVGVGDRQAQLPICDGDRFLTTSWWTTICVLGSIPPRRVDYLLQEDERMFYPYGDDRLRCGEVLQRKDIRFLINTELLYQHLIETGLDHLRESGVWFEPAFPSSMFYRECPERAEGKRRLFFYARPNNLRNLFYRGIEALDKAVTERVITSDEWEVVLVGKDVPELTLGGVLKPLILPTMGWKEYGIFVRGVDLGFCLMGTPHPSYPPLDLAASGAVVLTNKFGLKEDLRKYSDNIICSELGIPSLLDGLRAAVARAQDDQLRLTAFQANRISRSWPETLAKSIEFLE